MAAGALFESSGPGLDSTVETVPTTTVPETTVPETLVPEEIAPSNPKALRLTISMALGTCAEAETSVSVARGWEYAERAATRNAG